MKIFIDFDDVLFYSKKFIQDKVAIFKKYGISEEIFKKHYYQYLKNKAGKKVRRYNPKSQLRGIKKELNLDTREMERELKKFLSNTSGYIFSDGNLFLKNFKKSELFLISYSRTEFQKTKIDNSKISKYFKKIIITNGNKSQEILKNIKNDSFFIDDRVDYISEVKKKIPEIKTILMKRKEGRHKDNENKDCDFVVKNLKEALKIINKLK